MLNPSRISLANGVVLHRIDATASLGENGSPATALPPDLGQAIAERAAEAPQRPAIITPDLVVGYGALMQSTAALAARFSPDGNAPVLAWGPLGRLQPLVLLACLRSGRPLVPLDPQIAALRLWQTIAQTGADYLVHESSSAPPPQALQGRSLSLIEIDRLVSPLTPPEAMPYSSERVAFIVFTSGSTGVPKGVAHTVASLQSGVRIEIELLGIRPGDRVALVSPPSTLPTPGLSLSPLAAGATLLLGSEQLSMRDFVDFLRLNSATHLLCYAGFARALAAHPGARSAFASLRWLQVFGDAVTTQDCATIRGVMAAGARLAMLFGASESTSMLSWTENPVVASADGRRPLGLPLPDVELWLDRALAGERDGLAGELYACGIRVAESYWRDPTTTRASFLADPRRQGQSFYKTGDIVAVRADGLLHFIGRSDNQVKLRGLRIELEEIETAACALPGVRAACVVARRNAENIVESLVLHVALAEGFAFEPDSVRRQLRESLAAHMVPAAILHRADMPLTVTGKVDRLRLQELDQQIRDAAVAHRDADQDAWPDALSRRIAAIFAEEAGYASIEPQHVFREIGGDSLQAVNIVLRLEKPFGLEVEPEQLLGDATLGEVVARLAALVRRH